MMTTKAQGRRSGQQRRSERGSGNGIAFLAALAFGAFCGSAGAELATGAEVRAYQYAPSLDDGWVTATPEDLGLARKPLEQMTEALRRDEYPNVHAVLIAKNGRLLYEAYFDGVDRRWQDDGRRRDVRTAFHRNLLHEVRSVTKSVTAAGFGVALGSGAIESLDLLIFEFFPEHAQLATAEKRRITLRHALTMTAGLDWNESDIPLDDAANHEGLMYESDDPAAFILSRPLESEPGERWEYNGGLTTLLGYVVSRATGQPFGEYVRDNLFQPLGIAEVEWGWRGGDGLGGPGKAPWSDVPEFRWNGSEPWSQMASPPVALWLRPRDLLKVGHLYQNGGRWQGRQVLSEEWVEQSLQPHITKGSWREHGEGVSSRGAYGYQWHHMHYRLPYGELSVHAAQGNGGQRIWLVPELGLTVVHLAGNYNAWTAGYQADRLLLDRIVPWALGIEATYAHELPRPVRGVASGQWPMVELSDEQRAIYFGLYDDEGGDRLEVFDEKGVLYLTLPGSGTVHLIPDGQHVFAAGLVEDDEVRKVFWPGSRMHFVLDPQDEVLRYEWRERETGRVTTVGMRVSDQSSGSSQDASHAEITAKLADASENQAKPPEDPVRATEIRIALQDGVELYGCLWLPPSAGAGQRYPVLFKSDPYAGSCGGEETIENYARAGYAVVYAHVRGTGRSGGVFPEREYSGQELDDAVEVIGWLAGQDWSTGAVGMFGESWSGFNAIQVAMRKPPALKAIIAAVATEDLYHEDARFADGLLVLSDYTIVADVRLIYSPEPKDPFDETTLRNRFDRPPWSLLYLRHQRDGEFWRRARRLDADPDSWQVPTMMIGGWYDGYRSAVLRSMQRLRAPFKAIVGPWDHGMRFPAPEADLTAATLRWWDHWLLGVENGVLDEPALHAYMRRPYRPGPTTAARPGEWRAVTAWPPQGHRARTFAFTADRGLRDAAGEADNHLLRYVPSSGVQAGIWWGDPMPDQRPADAHSLVYESDPLDDEVQILGQPRARLRASADAPLAHWMVRLSDVAPDGTVTLVTGAGKNGAHRHSSADPELLTPGEVVDLEVPLHFTSWVFEPGHRIRVAVSNALWPMFWPSPHPMTTTLEVGRHGSRIELPTIPPSDPEATRLAALAVGSVNLGAEEARAFPAATGAGWIGPARVVRDEVEGTTMVSYGVGTISGITAEYQTWDADPARARYLGTLRVVRPWREGTMELYGETEVVSDATTFHYRHERRLLRDGQVVRERAWREDVPRDHQ